MTQHTPGPWTRVAGERFKHDASAGVKDSGGNYIACALDQNRYDRDEEVEANAHLIAAAPDLLAALTEVSTILRQRNQEGWEARLLGVVDAAIAKARGEPSA